MNHPSGNKEVDVQQVIDTLKYELQVMRQRVQDDYVRDYRTLARWENTLNLVTRMITIRKETAVDHTDRDLHDSGRDGDVPKGENAS